MPDSQQQPDQPNQPSASVPQNQDDVLSVLSEFETGLVSLRQLYAQRQTLQAQLRSKESELIARDQQLAQRTSELNELTSLYEAQVSELDRTRKDISRREQEVERRVHDLEAAVRAQGEAQRQSEEATSAAMLEIDRQRERARKDADTLSVRLGEVEKRAAELAVRGERLEKRAHELAQDAQRLEREKGELIRERDLLEEREAAARGMEAQFASLRTAAEEARKSADENAEAALKFREHSEQMDHLLAELKATVEHHRAEAQQSRTESEAAIEQVRSDLTRAREEQVAHERARADHELLQLRDQMQRELATLRNAHEEERTQLTWKLDQAEAQAQQLREESRIKIDELSRVASTTEDKATRSEKERRAAAAELEASRDQTESARRKLQEVERALESSQQQWSQQRRDLEAQLDHRRVELEDARRTSEEARASASEHARKAKIFHEHVATLEGLLDELRSAMDDQELSAKQSEERRRVAAEELQNNLRASHQQELTRQREELEALLAQARAQAESSAREATDNEKLCGQLRDQCATLEAQLGRMRADFDSLQSLAGHTDLRAQSQLESLKREFEGRQDTEVKTLREHLESEAALRIEQALGAQRERLGREWEAQLAGVVQQHKLERTQDARDVAKLATDFAQRASLPLDEAQVDRLIFEPDGCTQLVEMVRGLIASAPLGTGAAADFDSQQQINNLQRQLRDTKSQLRKVKETANLACSMDARALERRRQRLKLAKELLREQTDKVRKGSEAIRKRYEQCEAMLGMRQELANARNRIIEAERRMQKRASTNKVAVALLSFVACVGILGGLSWALARQVAPAKFEASSIIAADGRGRELTLQERKEWTTYHERVLADPRFHAMAAERFQRVGLELYSSPSAVEKLITTNISLTATQPGELTLRLQAEGATNCERILETFTASFASQANAAQVARTDGSVTKVLRAAEASREPIDNTQTYWAIAMLGGGVLVASVAGLTMWKRLAGAKTAFEQDAHVQAALESANWGDIPAIAQDKNQRKAA